MLHAPGRAEEAEAYSASIHTIANLIHDFIAQHGQYAHRDRPRLELLARSIYLIANARPSEASNPFTQHDYEHHI